MKRTVLLVMLFALVVCAPAAAYRSDPLYSQVASEIAGRPADVQCWTRAEWGSSTAWGAATIGGPRIRLAPWACDALDAFRAAKPKPTPWCAAPLPLWAVVACPGVLAEFEAMHTLAHEAQHTRGVRDERQADCAAFQWNELVARRLGADASYATFVRWDNRMRWEATRPGGYYLPGCPL